MASLCARMVASNARRHIFSSSIRCSSKVTLGDPVEHATGLEKREILAKLAGNDNPFDMRVIKRGVGSKAQPTPIPSAFDSRLVGCVCEEEATTINWMWLHKGEPRRCECGHWFNLVHKAPMTSKIIKPGGAEPDAFENQVSQALLELELNSDLKSQLRELHITKAREIELNQKKSIIIYVPIPKLKQFQKIQIRLVRELEKKFSGKHVVFVGERKILPKPTRKTRLRNKQKRPRSRTLTAVYDAILEDLVYPAEIVGKRIRVKLDGSSLIKVHLDKTQQTTVEHKVDTFTSVYKKLTGREVTFEFPESYL
ncbi:hypothetical protein D910_04982 [Dendroctonus ponderosae]|uniref:Small ribosomal subunit protein eS7 n=1 Tax=Dendroctonus ponderosae TaxID=77166 RepID=U4UAF9_DENPD|nr:hypothetical protein D910_04982 [Dendroctonus ponderosae]KAH1006672.1 hypothetical protein HUJ05_007382 [Dendroctonus ponderosae]